MTATVDTTIVAEADERIRATKLPERVSILGYEVSYSVSSALVSRDDLVRLMTEQGFASYIPKRPPTAKRALRRAINEWARLRSGDAAFDDDDEREGNARKKLVREIKPSYRERGEVAPVIYALVEELSLGNRLGLAYATAYRFRFNPSTAANADDAGKNVGTLIVSSAGSGPMAEAERGEVAGQIEPLWEKHRNLYNGADLSVILIDIIRGSSGMSVESGSGVWYLSERYESVVDRLEKLVTGFAALAGNGDSHFRVREQINWPRTMKALSSAAMDDVLSEIRQQSARMDGLEEDNRTQPGVVKETTLANVVKDLIGIRERAKLYVETLGMRDERISQELLTVSGRAVALAQENRQRRDARAENTAGTVVVVADEPRQMRAERD